MFVAEMFPLSLYDHKNLFIWTNRRVPGRRTWTYAQGRKTDNVKTLQKDVNDKTPHNLTILLPL